MLKSILKYFIYELCIKIIFSKLKSSFKTNDLGLEAGRSFREILIVYNLRGTKRKQIKYLYNGKINEINNEVISFSYDSSIHLIFNEDDEIIDKYVINDTIVHSGCRINEIKEVVWQK